MAILGIDEVGRGPLAGPLVVGAVILPEDEREWFYELKDSKKLTAKKRVELSEIIFQECATGLGWVSAKDLDQIGISEALKLATRKAVKSVQSLHAPFSQIIIDGKVNFLADTPLAKYTSTCIKGDDKIRAISAASIIAKVARDHYMIELAKQYPEYHFDQHVGYGTKVHVAAIYEYGLTDEHRKSFEPIKSLSGFTKTPKPHKDTTSTGKQAEQTVADYLESQGHTIIARNHKTYFYEIDIISTKDDHIYFTEVKYRKSTLHGNGLDVITKTKQDQMRFAALSYLKYTATDRTIRHLNPILAAASVSGNLNNDQTSGLTNAPQITWLPLT